MIRLPAVPSVVLDGFVEIMLRMLDAALAAVDVLGMNACRCEDEERGERRQGRGKEEKDREH